MLGHVHLRPTVIWTVGTKNGACESGETLVDARGDTDVGFGTKDTPNHQDYWSPTACSGKVDRVTCCCRPILKLSSGKIQRFLSKNLSSS